MPSVPAPVILCACQQPIEPIILYDFITSFQKWQIPVKQTAKLQQSVYKTA